MKKLSHFSRFTLAICLCSIVTFSNIYWLQPLIPNVQRSFEVDLLSANLIMSAPLLGMGLGLLIFACISDAIGRRSILLTGTLLGLLVSWLLPLVDNFALFLLLRFLQGGLLSACPAVAIPLLGEELRKSWLPTAVGYYIACNTIGGISSRLISGASVDLIGNWQAAGFIIAAISMLLFTMVYWIVPTQRRFKVEKFRFSASAQMLSKHLHKPQLLILYIIICLAFGCFVNLFSYLMIVLEAAPYSLPGSVRSLIFITFLGGTASASLAGKFSKRYGQLAGIATGIFIMLIGNLCLEFSQLTTMIAGMVLLAFGFFFCHAQASTLVGRSVKKGKGSAQALYSLFYYTGASVGIFFIAPFYEHWGWQGVLASTSLCLITCLALIALYQIKFSHQPEVIAQ